MRDAAGAATLAGMAEESAIKPCAVTFWTFAIPVLVGNVVALGVGGLARALYTKEALTTRQTAMAFTRLGAFWFAAGMTWIALNRRNGAAK